jgi:hypothetical protein
MMRFDDKFIFVYGLVIIMSGLVMTLFGVRQIEAFYAVYLIEFLIAVELGASFRRSLVRNLRPTMLVLLAGFLYVLGERILGILVGLH